MPSHVSEGAKALMARILKVNPDDRPSVDEVSEKRGSNGLDTWGPMDDVELESVLGNFTYLHSLEFCNKVLFEF